MVAILFYGDLKKEVAIKNPEARTQSSVLPEVIGRTPETVEAALKTIGETEQFVAEKTGATGAELTELVDNALVFVAEETIRAADEDSVRTDAESADIEGAIEPVVVEGALEETGVKVTSGENPILELENNGSSQELVVAIGKLHAEDAKLSSGESVAELAVGVIEKGKPKLEKVSERLGSNEGGWYEDKETGERSYVKFYENPDQGRVEYVANAIYQRLGIKAVRSELIEIDGRQGVASREVAGARPASETSQKTSEDVRNGFVADAYLANWDVVGLVYDNIVQGEDGLYRIDNGGSMIFRAQGGDKEFVTDAVPELESMLKRGRSAGEVFEGVTPEDIKKEAQELVEKLQPELIRAIVAESGLEGEARERVLAGLLGRREYLAERFQVSERKAEIVRRRLGDVLQSMMRPEGEQSREVKVRPRQEVVCDHDHIEGQRIDVIDKGDKGQIEILFKLRQDAYHKAVSALSRRQQAGDTMIENGAIIYDSASTNDDYELTDAFVFTENGVRVALAMPYTYTRTALGMVKVEISEGTLPEEIEETLNRILQNDLMVSDGLGEVPAEAERQYKAARYGWHHKIEGEMTVEQSEAAESLERAEVYPGYSTMVERGKHQEYLAKFGDMRAVHSLHTGDAESIYRVLTSGLMASSERYARGLFRDGMSTREDFRTGGGDSVFVRTFKQGDVATRTNGALVVMRPEVYDRTDWYAYAYDEYGRTSEEYFANRLSPEALFEEAQNGTLGDTNEQMFRTGIGADYIEAIIVDYGKDEMVAKLRAMGLEEVNGRNIEDLIMVRDEKKEAEKAAELKLKAEAKQKFLEGNFEGVTFGILADMANEDIGEVMSLMQVMVDHGARDQLAEDVHSWILDEGPSWEDLAAAADGKTSDGIGVEEVSLILYFKDTLGLDFAKIIEELKVKQEEKAKNDEW
jgi:hypothetical protein